MKRLILLLIFSTFTSTAIAGLVGSGRNQSNVQSTSLKQWHTLVTDIARFLTDSDWDGTSKVEYNSKFNGIQPGSALQALSSGSGMNIISRKCALSDPDLIKTEASDFGGTNEKGDFGFSAGVSVPSFLSGGLASANAGLKVSKNRVTSYEFSDISIDQIDESTALDIVNSPACFNSIKHRSEIYIVRGVLNMQLSMSQGLASDVAAGLNLKTKSAVDVGFDVSWDNQSNWMMTQNKPRPWFRIVTKFKLNRSKDKFELYI